LAPLDSNRVEIWAGLPVHPGGPYPLTWFVHPAVYEVSGHGDWTARGPLPRRPGQGARGTYRLSAADSAGWVAWCLSRFGRRLRQAAKRRPSGFPDLWAQSTTRPSQRSADRFSIRSCRVQWPWT